MNTIQEKQAYLTSIGYRQNNETWYHPHMSGSLDEGDETDWQWSTPFEFVDYLVRRSYRRGIEDGKNEICAGLAYLLRLRSK